MDTLTFNLPRKIGWTTHISKSWEELFYPSVAKKIKNADPRFKEVLETQEIPVDKNVLMNIFMPVYDKEIVSRRDYHLNREEQLNGILERMRSGADYFVFGIFEKATQKFVGGYLYRVKEDRVASTFRAFDREITQKYKPGITVDFWAEAMFIENARKYNKQIFTHGKDTHPRFGGIGLTLFKIKVGSRPYFITYEDIAQQEFPESEFLQASTPVIFFDQENAARDFVNARLYYNDQTNESFIHEFQTVFEWAGIKLEVFKQLS